MAFLLYEQQILTVARRTPAIVHSLRESRRAIQPRGDAAPLNPQNTRKSALLDEVDYFFEAA
ncbi:hypothetical protein [Bradyrhizobium sp.]|jgi:hypothetical protein|uniref:hypothetical protein n=1 Tax=Bradyrhizobium sp. TaxID=376 RepID=UPI003C163436